VVDGDRCFSAESRFAEFFVLGLPSTESGSDQAELVASHMDIAGLFGVFQYAEPAFYFMLIRSHGSSLLKGGNSD
jgi:hypothetical protein